MRHLRGSYQISQQNTTIFEQFDISQRFYLKQKSKGHFVVVYLRVMDAEIFDTLCIIGGQI